MGTIALFVDLRKAYDSVYRPALFEALKSKGINGKVRACIQEIYRTTRCVVHSEIGNSTSFLSKVGVRQGCPLSPLLFNIFVDSLIEMLKAEGIGVQIPNNNNHITSLHYADDLVILAEDLEALA